ncbi:MAG TPA: hypothetical protein VG452_01975 [Egibacteraceae bacterium]|nr:hypothetical protein [Egibacteraceae bacterium]
MIEVVAVLARHGLLEETHNILELLVDEEAARTARVDCLVYTGGPRVSRYGCSLLIIR